VPRGRVVRVTGGAYVLMVLSGSQQASRPASRPIQHRAVAYPKDCLVGPLAGAAAGLAACPRLPRRPDVGGAALLRRMPSPQRPRSRPTSMQRGGGTQALRPRREAVAGGLARGPQQSWCPPAHLCAWQPLQRLVSGGYYGRVPRDVVRAVWANCRSLHRRQGRPAKVGIAEEGAGVEEEEALRCPHRRRTGAQSSRATDRGP